MGNVRTILIATLAYAIGLMTGTWTVDVGWLRLH